MSESSAHHPQSGPVASRGIRAFEEVVLEHSNDAALLIHPKYGVVYASPAVSHVLGFEPHHFVGMLAAGWVHPDDVATAIEQRQLAVRHFHSGPVQIRGLHSDGSYHWFEAEWWHLANDHTVLHLRNAEASRAVAEEVARHAARTSALLRHATEIILHVDPATGATSALGSGADRLAGVDVDEVHWSVLFTPSSHQHIETLLAANGTHEVEAVTGEAFRCRSVAMEAPLGGVALYLLAAP